MRADNKTYEKSNKITTVALNKFSSKDYNAFLNADESIADRQRRAQTLATYLCGKFKLPNVVVKVVNRPQPHSTNLKGCLSSKLLGTYAVNYEVITLYNLTAVKQQVVSIKTMLDTLLHEFMHHYDHKYLKFEHSNHTAGFYKRINDLKQKLTGK